MSKRKLFALIVGISKYHHVKSLKGPYNDALALDAFLDEPFMQAKFHSISKKLLLNNEGRKDSIVRAWDRLFGKAERGDVCLFYFAGHGVREQTQIPAFRDSEVDGLMESIVCVDSKASWEPGEDRSQNTTLSDKELRWLIHSLSKEGIKVVSVFDCCSSGDNTRSLSKEVEDHIRQINKDEIPQRAYEGFIFHQRVPQSSLAVGTLQSILPLGNQIQLSACRDAEVAYELPKDSQQRRGVFTRALLETLEVYQGNISFHDLYHQVAHAMPQNEKFYQRPQFFFQSIEWEDRYLEFLSFAPLGGSREVGISLNPDTREWRLNLGGLHGVSLNTQTQVYSIKDKDNLIEAQVSSIHAGYSVIDFEPQADHPIQSYVAKVEGLAIRPLKVGIFDPESDESQEIYPILTDLHDKEDEAFYSYTLEQKGLDYQILLDNGRLSVCRPNGQRAIIEPLHYGLPSGGVSRSKLNLLKNDMQQVAQWTFLKELEVHQTSNLKLKEAFPLELRLFQRLENGEELEVPLKKNGFSVHLTKKLDTERPSTYLRMELKNCSEVPLYCALMYLSMDFEISTKILDPDHAWLEPGEILRSEQFGDEHGKDPFLNFFFAHSYIIKDKWPAKEDYFKLICSETQFEVSEFDKKALPMPYSGGNSRNFGSATQEPEPKALEPSWMVKTLGLEVFNPHIVGLPRALDRSNSFEFHVKGLSAEQLRAMVGKEKPKGLELDLAIQESDSPTRSLDPNVLSVGLGIAGAVLSPLIDWLIKRMLKEKQDTSFKKVTLKTANGMELSFPADATSAEIETYVQTLEKMGRLDTLEMT